MIWYLEHAIEPPKRAGNFFPREDVLKMTGFRSVYALSQPDALTVRKQGNSRGIGRFPVFSQELLLDFDNGYDEECKKAVQWAKDHDVSYSLYESGKKGMHLEMLAVPKYSVHVPHSQQMFVQNVMKVQADESLYRPASLYRLPGTKHQTTGRPKKRVESRCGNAIIDYEIVEKRMKFDLKGVGEAHQLAFALDLVSRRLTTPPVRGRRYQSMWAMAKQLKDAGCSATVILELVLKVNESWGSDAKEASEIERLMREITS